MVRRGVLWVAGGFFDSFYYVRCEEIDGAILIQGKEIAANLSRQARARPSHLIRVNAKSRVFVVGQVEVDLIPSHVIGRPFSKTPENNRLCRL